MDASSNSTLTANFTESIQDVEVTFLRGTNAKNSMAISTKPNTNYSSGTWGYSYNNIQLIILSKSDYSRVSGKISVKGSYQFNTQDRYSMVSYPIEISANDGQKHDYKGNTSVTTNGKQYFDYSNANSFSLYIKGEQVLNDIPFSDFDYSSSRDYTSGNYKISIVFN